MHAGLILVGSLLPSLATSWYIASIFKGTTRPHRTTYALLALISILAFASLIASHDRSGVWLALASIIQTSVVFVLSLKRGMGGKDPFDAICAVLCGVGIVAWLTTGESLFGLMAAIVADFLAVLPSLRKMWRHPHTEMWQAYSIDVVAGLLISLASGTSWRALLYPSYLATVNGLCAVIIIYRQRVVDSVKSR